MTKTALAAVFHAPKQPFTLETFPVLEPAGDCARLSLLASGVCGTDGHIYRGKLGVNAPLILGHEFIGKVEACPENDQIRVGDTAIVCVACPCGKCAMCESGNEANCLNMGVTYARDPSDAPHFFGGFAQETFAPLANLTRVPEGIPAETAAVFACAGPTALHALKLAARANIAIPEKVVVQGAGAVGTFAALYLRGQGARVAVVTARHNEARAEKLRALGLTDFFDWETSDVEKEIAAWTNGGARMVFEASGNPQAFAQGLSFLGNRGAYLVPGQYSSSGASSIPPEAITFKALQIIGSSQYDAEDICAYLAFLQTLNAETYAAIDNLAIRYPLSRINAAIEGLGRAVKTLIVSE